MEFYIASCECIDGPDQKQWRNIDLGYICVSCRSNGGTFDLLMGQERLRQVKYIAEYVGQSVKESVFRILKEAMATELAMKFNLLGQKGKESFRSLLLASIIYKCIQRNPPTKSSSKKDVEEAIKMWLSGARDREGGRKKRTKQIEAGTGVETNQQAENDQAD